MNFSCADGNQIQLISNKCDYKQRNSLQVVDKTRELPPDRFGIRVLFRKELEKEIQKRKRRDREIRKLRQQIKVLYYLL